MASAPGAQDKGSVGKARRGVDEFGLQVRCYEIEGSLWVLANLIPQLLDVLGFASYLRFSRKIDWGVSRLRIMVYIEAFAEQVDRFRDFAGFADRRLLGFVRARGE